MELRTGSLGVLEDFFGEELKLRGRLSPPAIVDCTDGTLKRLLKRLEGAGYWGAMIDMEQWAATLRREIGHRPLLPVTFNESRRATFMLYANTVVIPDPFAAEVLRRYSVLPGLKAGLLPYLRHLATIAPLVREGRIALIPSSVGALYAGSRAGEVDDLGDILYADLMAITMDNLRALTPERPVDATNVYVAAHRLEMYGLSTALDADVIDLLPSQPRRLEISRGGYSVSRSGQLAELFLPTFPGIALPDMMTLAKNSEAAAYVRTSLSQLLESPPSGLDTEEAAIWVRDTVEAELRPQLQALTQEARTGPSGDVIASAGISVSAALAELYVTGDLGPGTAVAGAAAWLPLAAQWIGRRRSMGSERLARRVMLNAIGEDDLMQPRWELRQGE